MGKLKIHIRTHLIGQMANISTDFVNFLIRQAKYIDSHREDKKRYYTIYFKDDDAILAEALNGYKDDLKKILIESLYELSNGLSYDIIESSVCGISADIETGGIELIDWENQRIDEPIKYLW